MYYGSFRPSRVERHLKVSEEFETSPVHSSQPARWVISTSKCEMSHFFFFPLRGHLIDRRDLSTRLPWKRHLKSTNNNTAYDARRVHACLRWVRRKNDKTEPLNENRDKNSFVQWDMRRAAMKLHTRDQAPKEGKQENKGMSFADWKPSRCVGVVRFGSVWFGLVRFGGFRFGSIWFWSVWFGLVWCGLVWFGFS